jgi:hypothetical protein
VLWARADLNFCSAVTNTEYGAPDECSARKSCQPIFTAMPAVSIRLGGAADRGGLPSEREMLASYLRSWFDEELGRVRK